ncbi:heterokaryon incompatibility protein-domain-containing protein [Stachybotrys elegans]|uniref:Heterokaryon incompatibility protein-domain-containing protein n=1 Tax=Stachybotrys elegans TaxID=80388 RepID=A0A8K0SH65_9HYPO|nr:heterokaryon incompatibility protein-domain-containing protein [Stachybotrys elegans]
MRLQPWTTRLRRRNADRDAPSRRPTGQLPDEVTRRLYDSLSSLYPPLDSAKHQLRTVTLEPGDFDDPISCKLGVASFLDPPQYEALSYAWGEVKSSRSISINGVSCAVSENLESAVRHLRYQDKPRVLWIDALCINQGDIAERNSHVRLMGTIYTQATQVLAYLGPEYNNSGLAFDFFETMPEDIDRHWDPETYPELKAVYTLKHTIAVNDLFDRAWWQRLWTVQESVLCEKLLFICGPRQLQASQFFGVAKGYFTHLYTCCQDIWYEIFRSTAGQPGLGDVCTTLGKIADLRADSKQYCLGQIISKFMSRQCADPHDKLYGLLGFASEEEAALIVPDYSKPIPEIYGNAVFGLMQHTKSLDLLSMRLPVVPDASGRVYSDLPSWVPDWRQDSDTVFLHDSDDRLCALPHYNATKDSECNIRNPTPGRLVVRGKTMSRIAVLSTDDNHMDAPTLRQFFQGWRDLAGVSQEPQKQYATSTDTTLEDAFWQTLCCSLIPDRERPRQDSLLQRTTNTSPHKLWYDAWWEWCEKYNCEPAKLMDIQSVYTRAEINVMGGWISTSINKRRFFTSDGPGWMGLVPSDAAIGDEIVLLEGGRVPYVVRRIIADVDVQTKHYQFVGAAYVHGLMDGSEWTGEGLEDFVLI